MNKKINEVNKEVRTKSINYQGKLISRTTRQSSRNLNDFKKLLKNGHLKKFIQNRNSTISKLINEMNKYMNQKAILKDYSKAKNLKH